MINNEVVYFKSRTGWNNIFSITHTLMIQFLSTYCGETFYGTFLDLELPDRFKREGIVVWHPNGGPVILYTGSSINICPSLDNFPFLSQLTQKRDIHLFRKLWRVAIGISIENGRKFFMEGYRPSLVKVEGLFLFHWNLTTHHF